MNFDYNRDYNLHNIINYYGINAFEKLDDQFIASYDDDDTMDSKIDLIDNVIRLVMIDE